MSEKFTYNQIEQQKENGYDTPTILVPTPEGDIRVGVRDELDGQLVGTYTDGQGKQHSLAGKEAGFSDQAQAYYANQLGESVRETRGDAAYEQPPMPTKDNPEIIEHGAERTLINIPRNGGDRTAMYMYARYFDENAKEQVVMRGTTPETNQAGKTGIPEKTIPRKRLEEIRQENAERMSKLMSGLALSRAAREESRSTGSVGVELDEHGLIKMPDFANSEAIEDESILEDDKEKENMLDVFWEKHNALSSEINEAIQRAGYSDPAAAAMRIAGSIDRLSQTPGINPEMVQYLTGVKQLCDEVARAGRNPHSRFYRNERVGLTDVWSKIVAIKK